MYKRGQFYLIVSMVIVTVIVGFMTVHNTIQKNPSIDMHNVKEKMEIESENVLDYSLYQEEEILGNFTKDYFDYLGEDTKVIYILNTSNDIEVYEYNRSNEGDNIEKYVRGNVVIVPVDSINYTFEMNKGKDFYFIITKERFGEKHVITNK